MGLLCERFSASSDTPWSLTLSNHALNATPTRTPTFPDHLTAAPCIPRPTPAPLSWTKVPGACRTPSDGHCGLVNYQKPESHCQTICAADSDCTGYAVNYDRENYGREPSWCETYTCKDIVGDSRKSYFKCMVKPGEAVPILPVMFLSVLASGGRSLRNLRVLTSRFCQDGHRGGRKRREERRHRLPCAPTSCRLSRFGVLRSAGAAH
jgi:hypothetical protein